MALPTADIAYSFRILWASKSRTFLTMLGIIIGVMSVVSIASVGQSAQNLVLGEVEAVGTNLITVMPGGSQENEPPPIVMGISVTTLTERDYRALRALPHVAYGSPAVSSMAAASYEEKSYMATINGTGEEFPLIHDWKVATGRFFSRSDSGSYARVAVLGSSIAGDLGISGNPVGKSIRIKEANFQIIGVMAERGSSIGEGHDKMIFVPVTTAQKLILGINHINAALIKADDAAYVGRLMDDIRDTLRRRHHITDPKKDDFSVNSAAQAISVLCNVTSAINIFLILVTAISLIVGGINIMNIMYVAVRERTREIGLRKALGARPRRIMLQFLFESAMIAFAGGVIGLVIGGIIAYGVSAIALYYGLDWTYVISAPAVAVALGVSAAIGLGFGVGPAVAAARLDAIESLRYE